MKNAPNYVPKYVHYFSLNFPVHSDNAAETEEELDALLKEAKSLVKSIVDAGHFSLEFYDTETIEDAAEQ
jgi:hypothetical protein